MQKYILPLGLATIFLTGCTTIFGGKIVENLPIDQLVTSSTIAALETTTTISIPTSTIKLIKDTIQKRIMATPTSTPSTSNEQAATASAKKRLAGTWDVQFGDGGDLGGFRDYTFKENGTFHVDGYPAWTEDGNYTITNVVDNKMTITFTNVVGTVGPTYTAKLELSADNTSLSGLPNGPYHRIEK